MIAAFRRGLTIMILAMMPVLSKAWWSTRTFDATTLEIPNSNGPYKMASIDVPRKIVYERDKNYWAADLLVNKGQYNFDKMVFDYYRDDNVAFEAFKAGAFDLRRETDAAKWANGYDFPAVKNGTVKQENIKHHKPEQVRSLIFNTRRPPFDDIRVREHWNWRSISNGSILTFTTACINAWIAITPIQNWLPVDGFRRLTRHLPRAAQTYARPTS